MSILNEYQEKAITTKIYRDEVALTYVILGLVGETAEMKEKSIELIKSCFAEKEKVEFSKEVGDVAWYMAALAEETGQKLGDFGEVNKKYEFLYGNTEAVVDSVVISAGAIAEVMKKALRDDYESIFLGKVPEAKLSKINSNLKDLVVRIQNVCNITGLDFETILKENIAKLQSRKDRDQIKGSGDNR